MKIPFRLSMFLLNNRLLRTAVLILRCDRLTGRNQGERLTWVLRCRLAWAQMAHWQAAICQNVSTANGTHKAAFEQHHNALADDNFNAAVQVIEPKVKVGDLSAAAPLTESSPTNLPSPSPRALRLASSLSKPSLRMLVGFPPLPGHLLASRCSTILSTRGETEPLDARDLQAAARHLWQQSGYKPHLPPLSQAPEGCPESPAGTHAAQADSSEPAPHPIGASSPSNSSADSDTAP